MKGLIDQNGRTLLTLLLGNARDAVSSSLTAWVDTAFDGELVMSMATISGLGLKPSSAIEATLADGSTVALPTYVCYLDWFGELRETEVIANEGRFPLLGIALLKGRRLVADYRLSELNLD